MTPTGRAGAPDPPLLIAGTGRRRETALALRPGRHEEAVGVAVPQSPGAAAGGHARSATLFWVLQELAEGGRRRGALYPHFRGP